MIWRGSQVNGSTAPAINATKEKLRVYPLAKKDNPPKMTFIDVSGKPFNTIHAMDADFFDEVNERRPARARRRARIRRFSVNWRPSASRRASPSSPMRG